MPSTPVDLTVVSRSVTRTLLFGVAGLTAVSVAGVVVEGRWGIDTAWGLQDAFRLGNEKNIPTWYTVGLLLIAAIASGILAAHARRSDRSVGSAAGWSGLAILFCLMSLDELMEIHEGWILPVRTLLNTSGPLYYAWVLPGLGLVLLLAAGYARFVRSLPRDVRQAFLLAAVLYVGGAVGMEMVSGAYYSWTGREDLVYELLTNIEECLEMLGAVGFIHAFLRQLTHSSVRCHVQ